MIALHQLLKAKTLHLPLKAKWYEMIESGVKTEEYRECKPYWHKRLMRLVWNFADNTFCDIPKKFGEVKFSYGYTKRTRHSNWSIYTSAKVARNGAHPITMCLLSNLEGG